MAQAISVASPDQRLSAAAWARYEQVGLEPEFELDELVLNWIDSRTADLDAKGALVALSIDRTIEGGSTVVMTLRDPNERILGEHAIGAGRMISGKPVTKSAARTAYRRAPVEVDEGWDPILAPDVIGRAIEIELDGVTFRLVKVRYSSAKREVELTFEDRIVYWLRRKRGERRASRGSCTRAEFVLSLLREVRARRYRFVCPELHTRQPIDAKAKATRKLTRASSKSSAGAADAETGGGFPAGVSFTVKGVKAASDQVRNLDGVLRECAAQGCSQNVMVATVCCVIQESLAKRLNYGDAAGPDSRGLFQQRAPWGPLDVRLDPRGSAKMFLTGGRGGQKGYKQVHGSLKRVPGGIESAVKRVQISVGGYQQHEAEARKIVSKWGGPGTAEGEAASGGEYNKSYQFSRNSDEDSWTAIKRLADEVGWRFFVVGNSVYFMSEEDLYARRARYDVRPDDPAILDLSYDVDWGKTVSEATLDVVLDRWGAPPGSVVVIDGYGPPDGRWLVTGVNRDYFKPTASVTLRQPGKALLEPAAERVTRASNASADAGEGGEAASSGSKGADAVYAKAKEIDAKNYPYRWGGGHGTRGQPSLGIPGPHSGAGVGYDCSGYVGACLLAGGYGGADPAVHSSAFGGLPGSKPGRGTHFTVHYNGSHVYIVFEPAMRVRHKRADTSRQNETGAAPRGPHLRMGPAYGSFSLCHFE